MGLLMGCAVNGVHVEVTGCGRGCVVWRYEWGCGWVSKFWTDIKVFIPIFTTSWVLCVTFHLDQK